MIRIVLKLGLSFQRMLQQQFLAVKFFFSLIIIAVYRTGVAKTVSYFALVHLSFVFTLKVFTNLFCWVSALIVLNGIDSVCLQPGFFVFFFTRNNWESSFFELIELIIVYVWMQKWKKNPSQIDRNLHRQYRIQSYGSCVSKLGKWGKIF